MVTSRQQPQHPPAVSLVARLAQNLVVNLNDGIGGQNPGRRVVTGNRPSLVPGRPPDIVARGFARPDLFCGLAGNDPKPEPGILEQLTPAR